MAVSEFNQKQAAECMREVELLRKESQQYDHLHAEGRWPFTGSRSFEYQARLATERAESLEKLAATYLTGA